MYRQGRRKESCRISNLFLLGLDAHRSSPSLPSPPVFSWQDQNVLRVKSILGCGYPGPGSEGPRQQEFQGLLVSASPSLTRSFEVIAGVVTYVCFSTWWMAGCVAYMYTYSPSQPWVLCLGSTKHRSRIYKSKHLFSLSFPKHTLENILHNLCRACD